jgi:DNA invertase Pin-like site-specific DNA recombinase
MKAIYSRISTDKQNDEGQIASDILCYRETCSGSIPFMDRPKAKELILNKDITEIQIREVSRLGRNLSDILKTIEYFTNKGIDIYIENLGLHTVVNGKVNSTATLIISVLGSVAQMERDLLIERTQIGVNIAKAKGLYKGRKLGTVENFEVKYKNEIPKIKKLLLKGVSKSDVAKNINVSRVTLDKILDRVKVLYFKQE